MKILMVRPRPSPETIGLQHLMVVEPLELEILCALKRDTDAVVIVDMILEKKSFESFITKHEPNVLCITGYLTNVSTIISYCETAKKICSRIVTVVGGVHCEVCPGDFEHESIDFRVVRNATQIFTGLLDHIETKSELPKGVLRKEDFLENVELPAFDFRVPFPDREAVVRYRDKYFYIFHDKVALLKTSFGCPYSCSFCFCRIITGGLYSQRPMDEVMKELKQIKEKEIYIVDDDFLIDRERLQEFISGIKQRNINKHFLVYGRADFVARNPDVIHQFAETGLKTVIIGFESFSDKELDAYNKNISVEMYKETMNILHREKIDCFATFIIPPEWDKQDFQKMVYTVKSLGIHFVNLQPLTPLPGTSVSISENWIIIDRKSYEKWDLAHISVQPVKLSVSEFYSEILKAYHSILYRPGVIWKYLMNYKPAMLYKMFMGGFRVTMQYRKKIKESREYA